MMWMDDIDSNENDTYSYKYYDDNNNDDDDDYDTCSLKSIVWLSLSVNSSIVSILW